MSFQPIDAEREPVFGGPELFVIGVFRRDEPSCFFSFHRCFERQGVVGFVVYVFDLRYVGDDGLCDVMPVEVHPD